MFSAITLLPASTSKEAVHQDVFCHRWPRRLAGALSSFFPIAASLCASGFLIFCLCCSFESLISHFLMLGAFIVIAVAWGFLKKKKKEGKTIFQDLTFDCDDSISSDEIQRGNFFFFFSFFWNFRVDLILLYLLFFSFH